MESRRKDEENRRSYDYGFSNGCRWVQHCGEPAGLTRLQELRSECDDEAWSEWFATGTHDPQAACARLAMLLHPTWEEAEDWLLARDWWREVGEGVEGEAHNPHFLCGFADGALSSLHKAADEP